MVIWALLGGAALAPAAAASPGELDGSFSGDGWLRIYSSQWLARYLP